MMSNGGNPYLIPTLSEAQIKALVGANALPSVTAADAGKVLTVSESGSWTPAAGGGGGASGLVVHELEDVDSGDYYLDKNYAEIETAVNNGQPVMVYSIPDGSANRIDILYVDAIRYDAEAQTMAYAVFAGEYIYGSDSNTGRLTASS